MYIYYFIDESGDTGYTKKSSRFFIVTCIAVEDAKAIRQIAKKIHLNKKDKKKSNGLHAYSELPQTKNKMLKILKNIKFYATSHH